MEIAKLFTSKMKKISHGLIFLLTFSIPLSSFVSVRLIVLLFVVSFFLDKPRIILSQFWIRSWDIILYLIVLILGLSYTTEISGGFKVLETNFCLVAIPIIFSNVDEFDEVYLYRLFNYFVLGLFIASVVCLAKATFDFSDSGDSQVFFYYRFTEIINSHPTYLAYFLIFGVTFGLQQLNIGQSSVKPGIISLYIIFFFLVLLLTGGQTAFVSLLLVFSFYILKFFLKAGSGHQSLIMSIIIVMIVIMFLSYSQIGIRANSLNDSWERFGLWQAAIDANSNIFFGVGTGDYKLILNQYFRSHDLDAYAKDNFNSHNQFIQIYLSNGFIGLLALLLVLLRPLYLSFRNNNPFGILVFFPFLIYGMTEVFLGRYQGVVFFALLHQIFVSYNASLKPAFSLKEA